MMRAMFYIVLLAIVVFCGIWLADNPGNVTLVWFGKQIETSIAILLGAVVLVTGTTVILYRIFFSLGRVPRGLSRMRADSRRRSGYLALTRGMVAVAAGDVNEATHQARRADALLEDPPLTRLLSAQASQLAGDENAAAKFFRTMLNQKETEFLGVRGLLTQAIKRGDYKEALTLAERAHRVEPKSTWVAESLFDLQIHAGRWSDAEATVDRAVKKHALVQDKGQRRRAVLQHQKALELEAGGDRTEALKLARKAAGLARDLDSAVIQYARLLLAEDRLAKAITIIRDAWRNRPHPELLTIWWSANRAEDALSRMRTAQDLAAGNPDHTESRLALAEAALDSELWGEARRFLAPLVEGNPSARVCRLMARLEECERKDLKLSHEWLIRATNAEPDPAWVCDSCGHAAARWSALCPHCRSFDTLNWQPPSRVQPLEAGEAAILADTGSTEMHATSERS